VPYDNYIKDGQIVVFLNSALYSKDAVFKCLYWYTDKYRINIETTSEGNFFRISLKLNSSNTIDANLEDVLLKLERDLLDFNLRDIVTKETKNIRDILIAKAFSHGEFDELPPGEISDPVGFNINQI
jgi:His-Xaa-Ser system protein HxsD